MVKPLRIGILMHADSRWMGGIIYIQNLVKVIATLPSDKRSQVELFLIVSSDSDPKFYSDLLPLVTKLCHENWLNLGLLNRLRWKIARIIPLLKDKRISLVTKQEHLDFLYPITGNWGISWHFDCSWAAWIPDFQHKYLPELFLLRELRVRDRLFQDISQIAPAVVFSSQVAVDDFRKFYPKSKAQTFVLNFRTVPEATWFTANPIEIQQKYQIADSFFLVSNQFWKHKNHKILVEALCILKQKNIKVIIVCTGQLNSTNSSSYKDEFLELIHQTELDEQFIILGQIPRFEQIQLMRRSLAVIQPSLFEGWSTVVEDARLLGKKLIISDLSVHFEQDPPDATFFQRNSPQDLADKLKLLLPTLSPGPDLEAEVRSIKANQVQCQTYGEQFLQIAQSSMPNL